MTVLTLQPTEATAIDTYIDSDVQTTNFGSSTVADARVLTSVTGVRRALYNFDFTGIPASAIVSSAILTLVSRGAQTARNVSVYRLIAAFVESQTTWLKRDSTNNWTTAGGDFDSTAWATSLVGGAGSTPYTWDVTTLIQAFVNGTYTHLGIILKPTDESLIGGIIARSSGGATASEWPKLEIIYTVPITIFPDRIESTLQVFAPTLTIPNTIQPPLIASTLQVFTPTLKYQFLPQVTGMQFDFNPELGMFQDTAMMIAAANDGDPIALFADRSISENHATQSTAGARGVRKNNLANGHPGVRLSADDWYNIPALASISGQTGSIFAIIRRHSDDSIVSTQIVASSAADTASPAMGFGLRYKTDRFIPHLFKNVGKLVWGSTHIQSFITRLVSWISSGSAYTFRVNGASDNIVADNSGNNGDWFSDFTRDNFTLGMTRNNSADQFFANLDIIRIIGYSPALSDSDRDLVESTLASLYGLQIATQQIICEGDSLTFGHQIDDPYPNQLERYLGNGWRVTNVATSGNTSADIISQRTAQVTPQYSASLTRNLVIVLIGTNDIVNGVALATIESNISSYCASLLSDGFEVRLCTLSNFPTDATFDATKHQKRNDLNSWLIANAPSLSSGSAIPIHLDPFVGDGSNTLDTTYWLQVGTHLTNAGYYRYVLAIAEQLADATNVSRAIFTTLFQGVFG